MIERSPTVIKGMTASSSTPNDLPRTGRLLTIRLLPWDTQVSNHASVLMLPALPPHYDVYVDHQ